MYLVDTLRPDHLGIYGHPRGTSPQIDAFARDATVFRNAVAQSSWTKTAVASLFTGLLPQTHRIHSRTDAIPEALPILPEILHNLGYATLGVITNGNVSGVFGFARGFDVYEELREGPTREIHQLSDRANEVAFALLARRPKDRPFFLYVHRATPTGPTRLASPTARASPARSPTRARASRSPCAAWSTPGPVSNAIWSASTMRKYPSMTTASVS